MGEGTPMEDVSLNLFDDFRAYKISYNLQKQILAQVNVSIRYLSLAQKPFFMGLLLINAITRSVCPQGNQSNVFVFTSPCSVCEPHQNGEAVLFLSGEHTFLKGP